MGSHLSFSRLANFLLVIVLLGYLLYIGQFILAPLAFSILFAFMLKPLSVFWENRLRSQPIAILLAFLIALLPILILLSIFSYQLAVVFRDIENIGARLARGVEGVLKFVESFFSVDLDQLLEGEDFSITTLVDGGIGILRTSLSSSSIVLAGIVLVAIFTFFILLYRKSFKNFILIQFEPAARDGVRSILETVQEMTRQYLYGMLLVMGILGILNTLGLWLIGIDYPVFWGFLAAFLAIIPYVGTTLGGTLPFLYALATTGTWWQPAAVVAFYFTVQNIEGNFITPKVVGGKVDINPLAAIISLLIGGMLWGISGLILALPVLASLKVTMQHIPPLEPIAQLLDRNIYAEQDRFFNQFDAERYRLSRLFRKKDH